jgi:adenylate cyclase
VLFTDIEAFSTFSEKVPPERLVMVLNEYFEAMSAIVDRHGGVITQFQGDAMLVTFNTVRDDPHHAAMAVRAALEIERTTRERLFGGEARLRTRCGINTGRIVAGAVGSAERLLYTVHGDEVNIAARLEQLNKKYGTYILLSESTVRAAGGDFSFRPLDEIAVRGRAAPTRAYTVEA